MISSNLLAVKPFARHQNVVKDALGSTVIVCSEETVCNLYSEDEVEKFQFECPVCGKLGMRMVEATPEQCGL